ncbi:hypothetical protein H5410_032848 [Solanum commersonii]|uniref:Uncharacterized protein n=1 Tax=Solanum commersonii TaxID=4109 RepID=A0A9J5YRF0_SOLCO|nr:hypothetical protein H5410_032848 [Solanum commersonii]
MEFTLLKLCSGALIDGRITRFMGIVRVAIESVALPSGLPIRTEDPLSFHILPSCKSRIIQIPVSK